MQAFNLFLLSIFISIFGITLHWLSSTSYSHLVFPSLGISTDVDSAWVNTSACTIHALPLVNADVLRFFRPVLHGPYKCNYNNPILLRNGTKRSVNPKAIATAVKDNGATYATWTCAYREILHAPGDNFALGAESKSIGLEFVDVEEEHIEVKCSAQGKLLLQTDDVVFRPKASVASKKKRVAEEKRKSGAIVEQLNVVYLFMDSVSSRSFDRHMHLSKSTLEKERSRVVTLNGMNKVGSNTYPNIVPTMGGVSISKKEALDDRLVFANFSSHGYVTMFGDDSFQSGPFNFYAKGFVKSPTDYYLRPFTGAVEDRIGETNPCIEDRLFTKLIHDLTFEVLDAHRNVPVFAFAATSRITHEDFNGPGIADFTANDFLSRFISQGYDNNTVLFFASDHGYRLGSFRTTLSGSLEDRHPFMHIIFPPWFPTKYPIIWRNLRINERRLTTNFDIYATLQHIIHFDGKPQTPTVLQKPLGQSLFAEVPDSRTCDSASIPPHWCGCFADSSESLDYKIVWTSAKIAAKAINDILWNHTDVCAIVDVQGIEYSRHRVIDASVPIYDVIVVLSWNPSGNYHWSRGMMESVVRYNAATNEGEVVGDFTRIDPYSGKSQCLPDLAMYCYCLNDSQKKSPSETLEDTPACAATSFRGAAISQQNEGSFLFVSCFAYFKVSVHTVDMK